MVLKKKKERKKYHTFSCISQSVYNLRVQFSFEKLPKIENFYVSRVGEKRNLAKYEKNEIFPSKKKKLAFKHIAKRVKMFPIF